MSLTCPRCDEWCPVDAQFCPECGCRLGLDAVRAPDLPTPPKASILDRDCTNAKAYTLDSVDGTLRHPQGQPPMGSDGRP